MAMKIDPVACIDCDACREPCPNKAIYEGGESYEWGGATHATLSEKFYIVWEKCTECVGHYDEPQCVLNCPIDCIVKDPDHVEERSALMEKKVRLHGA